MCGKEMCWIGFEEPPETETWYLADGARTAYRNWDQQYKQPGNNRATDETVAIMHSRRVNSYIGTWFDTREKWGDSAAPFARRGFAQARSIFLSSISLLLSPKFRPHSLLFVEQLLLSIFHRPHS